MIRAKPSPHLVPTLPRRVGTRGTERFERVEGDAVIREASLSDCWPNLDKPQDKYLHEIIFYKMRRKLWLYPNFSKAQYSSNAICIVV